MIMIEPGEFVDYLRGKGLSFYAGVPDSLLKDICAYITENGNTENHVITANEGAAIGLVSGYHLATGKAGVVYMQNSGTGNAINPLLSLADPDVYSIPMFVIIGWRGEPGIHDEPQHKKQGRVQEKLLSALGYSFEIMENNLEDAKCQIDRLYNEMMSKKTPVVLLVRKGVFSSYSMQSTKSNQYEMTREEAINIILENIGKEDRVVSTTGMASREIYELRDKKNEGHEKDFLTVGSMGHSIMIALGMALFTNRKVYCIDGDGSAIMHMGSLGIVAGTGKANLVHIVINNGAHDSVGGQPTIGYNLDFNRLAKDFGYCATYRADDIQQLKTALEKIRHDQGPSFLEIRVKRGARKDLGRPKTSPIENKQLFMDNL